ncbi:MAG: hypothetical protein GY859_33475, partial [Desulfobacterales bacterium]|nr:hypothetical protein [Desulfobacterales bacterium]
MAENSTNTPAVYSARPTIRVDGKEHPKVRELVLEMKMTESDGGMSALELRFANWASDPEGGADYAFEDDAVLRLGAAIAVYAGDVSEPMEIFRGRVTGLEAEYPGEGPPELVALAEDVFQTARMTRRTRVHENVSVAGLADDLARRLGLTPVITEFAGNIGTWVQLNESDLAFLRRILVRYDGDVQVVGTELHVSPREEVRRGTLELALHDELLQARVVADLAHQVTRVTVNGWDPIRGARVAGASNGAAWGPGAGSAGAGILRDRFSERSHHISHAAAASDEEARAMAD